MRELWSTAEPAVLLIEHLPRGSDNLLNHPGRKRAAFSRERLRVCYRSLDQLCLLGHVAILLMVGIGDRQQHAAKAGAAVVLIGRKVSSAVKRFSVRGKECRERPAALSAEGLHGNLVAAVNVWPFVAVHLDGNEALVHDLRNLERFLTPPMPVGGLVHGRAQVGGRGV